MTQEPARGASEAQDEWAVQCLECGDGPRRFSTEEAARETYERDARLELVNPVEERHTFLLLRRSAAWQTVTTTAWDGRRDASAEADAHG